MFVCFVIIAFMIAIQGSNGQEECPTTSGSQGICISIYECDSIYNLLWQSRNFLTARTLRDSQCGYDEWNDPKVCCPVLDSDIQTEEHPPSPSPSPPRPSPSVVPDPPDVTNHPNLRLLEPYFCGSFAEPKITGGNRVGLSEFPWMALIAYNVGGNSTDFKCGGTLINKRYVLTAAHCVTGLDSGNVLAGVRVGDHYLDMEHDCEVQDGGTAVCAERYQNFFVENFHVHSGYDKKRHENDIALIRLNGDANYEANHNVRPICLPYGNSAKFTSDKAIVTGWGKTLTLYRSQELLKVKLDIVPNDECAMIYRKKYGLKITYKQLCAAGENWKDSCAGDSGGPLQFPKSIKGVPKYIQYGVVSFGPEACGTSGYPGVYTRIVYYMDWILDTITE